MASAAWGLVIAPFNSFDHHHLRSVTIGLALLVLAGLATIRRSALYGLLRRQPAWLFLPVGIGIASLWIDGGWRSSFYLASYAAIGLAAVAASRRSAFGCGLLLAAGYVAGLAVNGYTWSEFKHLHDADSVVANTGGYLLAAGFFSSPVAWLGSYIAHIHQTMAASGAAPPKRLRTKHLSGRESQVVQLVADGLSNEQIAERLVLSARTVQTHVRAALKKTGTATRTELAVLAVREGLVPLKPAAPNGHRLEIRQMADPTRDRAT